MSSLCVFLCHFPNGCLWILSDNSFARMLMSEKSRPERECRNRMRSDHPRLCLWYIKYDWKRGTTMKDDDDDFIDDLIAYKIITDDDKKSRNSGSSGGCLSWIRSIRSRKNILTRIIETNLFFMRASVSQMPWLSMNKNCSGMH